MKDEIITLETAKLAKEKGFDEPVYAIYSGNQLGYIKENDILFRKWNHCTDATYSAPTQSLLQRWLREKNKILIIILLDKGKYDSPFYPWDDITQDEVYFSYIIHNNVGKMIDNEKDSYYNTYEEALEAGLEEALKLIA